MYSTLVDCSIVPLYLLNMVLLCIICVFSSRCYAEITQIFLFAVDYADSAVSACFLVFFCDRLYSGQ